jgi:phosphoserine phosphatase RsbU/P
MNDLGLVLEAFRDATQCEAAVWVQHDHAGAPRLRAGTPGVPPLPADLPSAGLHPIGGPEGQAWVAPVPGPRRAWLVVGPCLTDTVELDRYVGFLLPVVAQYLQSALEVEHAATELAERYEEINLLYTISEILGRTIDMDEAAHRILEEVSGTVGARRASILVYDAATGMLRPAAVLGTGTTAIPEIAVADQCSISARVFRTQHPVLSDDSDGACDAERPYRRGTMLSVPIMWTAPRGAEPLGVVNLSDRRSRQPFTAGDQKLIAAIATQIGTAIQNARLVRASVEQQRLAHEMQLAHDLQMKLLPDGAIVAPDATVAARVVPAESVGGDFYNLFRLGGGAAGVMVGDVSGHGYQAALIMALTMSASTIQAQARTDPGETLHALYTSVRDELSTTEMFISAFYAIVDRQHGELRYANTGHPHAFVVSGDGTLERLAAVDVPLGMGESPPATVSRPWSVADDLLVVFTDGISDARAPGGERLGEERVLDLLRQRRADTPQAIVAAVFAMVDEHVGDAPRRDDLTLVVLRS